MIDSINHPKRDWPLTPLRSIGLLGCVMMGYIGIYLCRKNLSVAMPMIQTGFGVTKAQAGIIASYSTVAYAAGKIFFGPVIDRFGGRLCFLWSLAGVAAFGALGAFAPSLGLLAVAYSLNRFAGSAGWGSMVKQVPGWFPPRHLALALAVLSLSFVFGGVCALILAGRIAALSGNNWHAVMGLPSLVLLAILLICFFVLPKNPQPVGTGTKGEALPDSRWQRLRDLAGTPQFWVVCSLSFMLTITRETFNTWTVDFFKTEGGPEMTNQIAAFLSTPYDAAGAVGILLLGWLFDRVTGRKRAWMLFCTLALLAALIFELPALSHAGRWQAVTAVGVIGFLSYGPYSLLAGILSLEIRGPAYVATVAGCVDASGYLAGVISGYFFGRILDTGGYRLGFQFLAAMTLLAALLCLLLKSSPHQSLQQKS